MQDEIRESIKKQKLEKERKQLMAEIRQQVPVWSLYPGDIEGAMPLEQIASPSSRANARR